MPITITDPMGSCQSDPGIFERTASKFFSRYLVDPRDFPFVKLIAKIMVSVVPFAIVLHSLPDFPVWLGIVYLAPVLFFLGPVILMLHNTSHRPFFRQPYGKVVNRVMGIFFYPLFGEVSASYFSHHMGMHHREENLQDDLSTTMFSQRDSFIDFLKYVGDFFVVGLPRLLNYLRRTGRKRLMRRTLVAELSFYFLTMALAFFNFKATLFVLIIPFIIARFGMMAGNWAQHAFIDPMAPDNIYRNSITCINSTYNRRCFNDGYHIGHHLSPSRHWTEMPADFLANRATYLKEKCIVFRQLDYFQIWCLLMLKKYDVLANYLVDLEDSATEPTSRDAQIELLKARTGRIAVINTLANAHPTAS